MAVTTRRKPASDEVEQLRAEIDELRQALRAVAGLAFGIGINRAPVSAGGSARTVADVCRMYGISGHTATIEKLFSP
jgi:hypothetical protein